MKTRLHSALALLAITLALGACSTCPTCSTCSGTPGARASTQNAASVEREIRQLSAAYDQAWLEQDAAAFERLLADDVTQVDPDGNVLTKAEVIASAKSGDTKLEIGYSDETKIKVFGDVAILTGRWTEKSVSKIGTTDARMRDTVVLVKRHGNWQVLVDQVTIIKPK